MYERMPLKARPIFGIRKPDGTLGLMELEDVILALDKRLEAVEALTAFMRDDAIQELDGRMMAIEKTVAHLAHVHAHYGAHRHPHTYELPPSQEPAEQPRGDAEPVPVPS